MMTRRQPLRDESGALLLILMVGVAVMSIGLGVAVQAWSVVWQRDSEEELIFRGNQYVDAILAYRKDHNGQFPTNLDDLMKLGPRHLRYIRKMFRDPLNSNGKWGLLYLMPGGQGIYDSVVAQRALQSKDASTGTGDGDVVAGTGLPPGVTPFPTNLNGNGSNQAGLGQSVGFHAPGSQGVPGGGAGALGMSQLRQNLGIAPGAGMGSALTPPPKPVASSFDEDSASEPPIGWPIVGVISRVDSKKADKTFKIYRGHDKANDWQFHVFDRGAELQQAPLAALPGGSVPPFIGPGYGGTGPIGGLSGSGPRAPGKGLFAKPPGTHPNK